MSVKSRLDGFTNAGAGLASKILDLVPDGIVSEY
jgi:hypothetical protein